MLQQPVASRTARRQALVSVLGIILVAVCLRPALTSVGPLLPDIGVDQGLGEVALGLLGALPLIAFGVVSPSVHRASGALGVDRTIFVALLVLAIAIVIRSYTGSIGLWLGTIMLGSAIAVGNVLIPVVVKRDFAAKVSRVTGLYTTTIVIAAAAASALAIPLASIGGWRFALAIWALLALLAVIFWIPRDGVRTPSARPTVAADEAVVARNVWRIPTAWLVTAFMGIQSTSFYIMITWLPTIEGSYGFSAEAAGFHLFLYQSLGIVGSILISTLMKDPANLVVAAVVASVPLPLAVIGILLAPSLLLVWAAVAGIGSASALVVALTLISTRGRSGRETAQLSGMAQSLGYLMAAAGPIAAGFLAETTGKWEPTLLLLAALGITQVAVALRAGSVQV